jgi:hypothetical protein
MAQGVTEIWYFPVEKPDLIYFILPILYIFDIGLRDFGGVLQA